MRASSMTAVAAECPAPTTTVCSPRTARARRSPGSGTGPPRAAARSPRAGSPSAPAGFGCRHVPDVSITARASSRSSPPGPATWTVKGWRPAAGVRQPVPSPPRHRRSPWPGTGPGRRALPPAGRGTGRSTPPRSGSPAPAPSTRTARGAGRPPGPPARATERTAARAPIPRRPPRGGLPPQAPAAQGPAPAGAPLRRPCGPAPITTTGSSLIPRLPPIEESRCIEYPRCIEICQWVWENQVMTSASLPLLPDDRPRAARRWLAWRWTKTPRSGWPGCSARSATGTASGCCP